MNKASLFIYASWAGLVALCVATLGYVQVAPFSLGPIAMIFAILACLAMLWARGADEYTSSLWQAGTSTAFGVTLISFFGLTFAAGFIDGVMGVEKTKDIHAETIPVFAVTGFYIGLFLKRLFGD